MSFAQKIVWITDTHITESGTVEGVACHTRLRQLVEQVNRYHGDADCCVASGDLTDLGAPGEYAAFHRLTQDLSIPLLPMIGNHDKRPAFLQAMPQPGVQMPGFAQFRYDLPEVSLLCLDTHIAGDDGGALDDARLGWLAEQLRQTRDRSVLVFAHHPPGPLGLGKLDEMPLYRHEPLIDLLASASQPLHLCCGHVHRPLSGTFKKVPFTTLRALAHQTLPPQKHWDWDDFVARDERPQYGVILIGSGQIVIQMHDLEDAA